MAKVNGDFDISLMHLNMALNDTSTCMFSSLEIKFHIAHVNEVRGESHKAKELYEELLQEPEISANLKSDVLRQLGWMFHCIEALGERNPRLHTAIQYLKESNECSAKKNHGKTLYLLGRCSAGEKKFIYDLVIHMHVWSNQSPFSNVCHAHNISSSTTYRDTEKRDPRTHTLYTTDT